MKSCRSSVVSAAEFLIDDGLVAHHPAQPVGFDVGALVPGHDLLEIALHQVAWRDLGRRCIVAHDRHRQTRVDVQACLLGLVPHPTYFGWSATKQRWNLAQDWRKPGSDLRQLTAGRTSTY